MMTSVYRMGHDQIMKFVTLWKESKCLWDMGHVDYKNREARNDEYSRIATLMGIEGMGPREVAQKIKNIRTTYHQECLKIRNPTVRGGHYKPRVPWFQMVHSICSANSGVTEATVTADMVVDYSDDVVTHIKDELLEEYAIQDNVSDQGQEHQQQNLSEEDETLSQFLPQKFNFHKQRYSANRETEFDLWSKSVAVQLNAMETKRALNLQLQIQTLITNERLAYEEKKEQLRRSRPNEN